MQNAGQLRKFDNRLGGCMMTDRKLGHNEKLKQKPVYPKDNSKKRNSRSSKGEELGAKFSDSLTSIPEPDFLGHKFSDSEIIIGLVGAVGTRLQEVTKILEKRLIVSGYSVYNVSISTDIIPKCVAGKDLKYNNEYERISLLMDAGNEARKKSKDDSILALGAASWIATMREKVNEEDGVEEQERRKAFIVSSLKHPAEAARFREIYPRGFYLIGVYADEEERFKYLTDDDRIKEKKARELMLRDKDEQLSHGQHVANTFHMSDVFVRVEREDVKLKSSLWRFLEIIFAHPNRTPTFDEYAMFLAFSASLRSADLSRQVGAVITKNNEIIATGANDCPKYGGGLYWPEYDTNVGKIVDQQKGRDYMRGEDSNVIEQMKIIDDISEKASNKGLDEVALREILEGSQIRDITEFGRVVHAEMEALICCSRNNISARNATMYCTTFPCHHCAKHIIAAGIKRVVYVEPYAKSKAGELHDDSIFLGFGEEDKYVYFEPFVGIGPRRFFDLFSVRLGSGFKIDRKDKKGKTIDWKPENARLRLQMLPCSYLELEHRAGDMFKRAIPEGGLQDV